MARLEMRDADAADASGKPANADTFYQLGIMYSIGGSVPADFIAAHKWFNIAAMHSHKDAVRLRREVAAQMSDAEIGLAQRAARDWLKAHQEAPGKAPEVRAA